MMTQTQRSATNNLILRSKKRMQKILPRLFLGGATIVGCSAAYQNRDKLLDTGLMQNGQYCAPAYMETRSQSEIDRKQQQDLLDAEKADLKQIESLRLGVLDLDKDVQDFFLHVNKIQADSLNDPNKFNCNIDPYSKQKVLEIYNALSKFSNVNQDFAKRIADFTSTQITDSQTKNIILELIKTNKDMDFNLVKGLLNNEDKIPSKELLETLIGLDKNLPENDPALEPTNPVDL
jgi:hypothetical protein